jgi:hypothetical protein
MAKEGYKPTSGMQSAARRAIKLKEQGKAKGAGTAVGWTRAGQLARGETLSLSTVKRMYSYFSRHEVDKKGKDWDNAENPSNGKIMWLAWGGDAGFSWSRKITQREKNMKKSIDLNEAVEEIKDILDDVVNPADTVVEIPDDENITKALRAEVTKEQLGMVIEHLMEAIESMIEMPEEDGEEDSAESDSAEMEVEDSNSSNPAPVGDPMKNEVNWPVNKAYENCGCETCKAKNITCDKCEECMSKSYESDNQEEDKWDNIEKACWTGYTQRGMKEKNGRMVPNCVPVEKSYDEEDKEEPIKKSLFNNLDPYELVKRKFNTKQREEMAAAGKAMPDGSYPIDNKTDLMNAIRSWGRGGADPKVKEHIKRRAKALGLSDIIPDNWK